MPRTKPKAPRRVAPSRAPAKQHRGVVAGLPYAVSELTGRRDYMEDAFSVHAVLPDDEHQENEAVGAGSRRSRSKQRGSPPTRSSLFGVFDGHGGDGRFGLGWQCGAHMIVARLASETISWLCRILGLGLLWLWLCVSECVCEWVSLCVRFLCIVLY
jgi:hypothetical protein